MKPTLLVCSLFFILYLTLFPGEFSAQEDDDAASQFNGRFVIKGNPTIYISIEKGWERNGWVPVIVDFSGMRFKLQIKGVYLKNDGGNGEVSEALISGLLVDGGGADLLIYEDNRLRTRLELAENRDVIGMEINGKERLCTFYLGDLPLKIPNLHVKVRELDAGDLYEVFFFGANFRTRQRFTFNETEGIIYTDIRGDRFSHIGTARQPDADRAVWAVKIYEEQRNLSHKLSHEKMYK